MGYRLQLPVLLSLLLFLITIPGFTQAPVVLIDGEAVYSLGGHIALFEDPGGELTISEVLSAKKEFVVSYDNEPNMGFTKSVYWVRLQIINDSGVESWIIDHTYAPMDYVDLFRVQEGRVVSAAQSGDRVVQKEKALKGRTSRFSLGILPGETGEIYLRFETASAMVFPLKIWQERAYVEREHHTRFYLGLYFGFLLVMIVYNLFIYASTREISYLYYVLFVAANTVFQACLLGVAQVYLWPGNVWWTDHALVFFASLAVAFSALFTRSFLQVKKRAPKLTFTIDLCLAVALVNSAICLFAPYSISIMVTNTMLIVFSIVYVAVALVIYRRGYKPARLYLLAWSMLLIAVFIVALKNFGVVPSNWFTSYILQIGSVFEIVLLALAVTDRLNALRMSNLETERMLRVAQQKELQATTDRLYYDHLTGLPNRNKLLNDAEELDLPHLFLINVDNFSQINDYYGNKMGDTVLLEIAHRIATFAPARPSALYKLHADEFALIVEGEIPPVERVRHGEAIRHLCEERSYTIGDTEIQLNVSIGISGGEGYLLEQADMALSEARRTHKSVRIFDPSMETKKQYESNLKWVGVISDALKRDAIIPFFQPIFHNATDRLEKYECLIRILNTDDTILSPGIFLPVAKASKLYPELSRRMIAKCFDRFRGSTYEFSLNLSVDDILHDETLDLIRTKLDDFDGCHRVVFEILESEGIHRYDLASRFIEEMKSRGCKIAIDDFGSGYSNFEHILRLKVDYLKLDSSLIKTLDTDEHARAIVETVQQFASRIGIRTVAEFVHSVDVHRAVKEIGIDYSQGNFLGAAEGELKT